MNIKGQRYNGASVALERLSDNLDSDDETECKYSAKSFT